MLLLFWRKKKAVSDPTATEIRSVILSQPALVSDILSGMTLQSVTQSGFAVRQYSRDQTAP